MPVALPKSMSTCSSSQFKANLIIRAIFRCNHACCIIPPTFLKKSGSLRSETIQAWPVVWYYTTIMSASLKYKPLPRFLTFPPTAIASFSIFHLLFLSSMQSFDVREINGRFSSFNARNNLRCLWPILDTSCLGWVVLHCPLLLFSSLISWWALLSCLERITRRESTGSFNYSFFPLSIQDWEWYRKMVLINSDNISIIIWYQYWFNTDHFEDISSTKLLKLRP